MVAGFENDNGANGDRGSDAGQEPNVARGECGRESKAAGTYVWSFYTAESSIDPKKKPIEEPGEIIIIFENCQRNNSF